MDAYIAVVGGVNIDVGGRSFSPLVSGDSNPGVIRSSLGGVGRNIAHNLALLSVPVKLVTALGDDDGARRIRESCRVLGIDLLACTAPDAATGSYLFLCDSQWATSMNRIVFRFADVLLMRAEALAQLGRPGDAIILVNDVRNRAHDMIASSIVSGYAAKYNVHYAVGTYNGSYTKEEAMKIVKMERRLELAMESERFFDLVRWGDAATVLNKYFTAESAKLDFLSGAHFTADKNEYLPIPFEQISSSNGRYTQNCGQW